MRKRDDAGKAVTVRGAEREISTRFTDVLLRCNSKWVCTNTASEASIVGQDGVSTTIVPRYSGALQYSKATSEPCPSVLIHAILSYA